MSRSKVFLGLSFVLMMAFLAAQSFSQGQDRPQRGRGGQGGPGGQGGQMARPQDGPGARRDPEMMRRMMQERMMQRVRQSLNATDQQWDKIAPALEKVMTLSREIEGMGGFGGRAMAARGRGPVPPRPGEEGRAPEPESKLEKARMELLTALDDGDEEQIAAKLKAFRDARTEAEKELAAAREQLKKTVTLPQEAELVLMGYLK